MVRLGIFPSQLLQSRARRLFRAPSRCSRRGRARPPDLSTPAASKLVAGPEPAQPPLLTAISP